jgi:hypothetical protein
MSFGGKISSVRGGDMVFGLIYRYVDPCEDLEDHDHHSYSGLLV